LTSAEIHRLFPDQEISEAAGVLEMISKTPQQMMLVTPEQLQPLRTELQKRRTFTPSGHELHAIL
jgi:hypothetical protein